jgi:hypothetical protein
VVVFNYGIFKPVITFIAFAGGEGGEKENKQEDSSHEQGMAWQIAWLLYYLLLTIERFEICGYGDNENHQNK